MSEEEILKKQWKERENLKPTKFYSEDYVKKLQKRIDKAIEYKERLRKEVNKSYIVCDEKDKKIKELNKRINYAEVMINGALAEFGSFDEFWDFLVELREVLTGSDKE